MEVAVNSVLANIFSRLPYMTSWQKSAVILSALILFPFQEDNTTMSYIQA